MWMPLVAFLAAVGGAGAVIFLFKDRMNTANAPAQLAPSLPAAAAPPSPEGPSAHAEAPSARASGGLLPVPAEAAPAAPIVPAAAEKSDKSSTSKSGKTKAEKAEAGESRKESAAAPSESNTGEKGFLTIDTYPWTKVSVNGRQIGTTPLVRSALPAGTYTVVLENPDEKISERVTVTIKSGETVSKRLAF